MRSILPLGVLCCFSVLLPYSTSESISAHILAENLQQDITSTALNWITVDKNFDYKHAVVGANETDGAEDDPIKQKVYVCRARQTATWVAGYVRPADKKCLVTSFGLVHHMEDYQILVNTENTARLTWVRRGRYETEPQGTIINSEEPRTYIGRKPLSNNKLNYILGYLDMSKNFGKYTFVNEHNEQSTSEDGEILVESEPVSYELHDIVFDNLNKPQPTEPRILGFAILKNDESDDVAKVDSVILYNFTYKVTWGYGHGLLTGLPLHIYQKKKETRECSWGINEISDKDGIHQIEYILPPGTAVNVTLKANYVNADISYTATLVSVYKDKVRLDRKISESLRESTLKDIIAEYSPVYFLSNNSFVPTTTPAPTTTPTTTTTMATTKIMTTVTESLPIVPPNVENTTKPKKIEDGMDHGENSVLNDDSDAVSSLTEKKSNSNSGFLLTSSYVLISILVIGQLT